MFPYRDENPAGTTAYFTFFFIAVCTGVLIYGEVVPASYEDWIMHWGLKPSVFWKGGVPGQPSPWLSLLASPWLHAGWLHLLGNIWFLWLFGDNVEDQLGHGRFFIFYILCGLLAALTQALVAPGSNLPLVGASGAIAGVLAAYLRFFPKHRVRTLLILFILVYRIRVPAALFIVLWLLAQVAGQFYWAQVHAAGHDMGGVAYGAHIGGFAAGFILAGPFSHGRPPPRKVPPPEPF